MSILLKRYSRFLIILLLSIVTVVAMLQLGEIEVSRATLAQVNWGWYGAAFFVFYLSLVARGLRWRRILQAMGWSVGQVYTISLIIAGMFGSMILPARAGDIGRVAMLKQDHDIPVAKAIASITTERALDVFSILSLAAMAGYFALQDQIPVQVLQFMGLVGILFLIGLGGLLTMPVLENWFHDLPILKRVLPPKLWQIYQKIIEFGFSLIHGVRALGKNPLLLLVTLAESFMIWLYDGIILYCVLMSIGVDMLFSQTLFTSMISGLSVAVPVMPGGVGQFEVVLISLFKLFTVPDSQAYLAALLLRFAAFWTFIPVGALITYLFGFSRLLDWSKTATESTPASVT
ncbi:lysylphosphatidylglycerol synthase transmembrane domain-containing protein [Anaerolineales bacterium HSG6]|nr:lysylphosphatidylglycerol synthase transmembrane domain-containing protein [Anaerolineales bacterium HSG6]